MLVSPNKNFSSYRVFTSVFFRDLTVYFRYRGSWINPLFFILVVITLFSLGFGADNQALRVYSPSIIWVTALLAVLLSLDSLFKTDFDDGSVEQLILSSQSLYLSVLAKILAHWFVTGFPIVLATPLISLMLGVSFEVLPELSLGLLLGTGILSFIGAIGASLTVSLASGGLLLSLLSMPLYVPAMIFGVQYLQDAIAGWPLMPSLSMLIGLLLAAVVLSPLAIMAGLKLSVEA